MEVIAANADSGFHRSCCGPAPKTKIRRHKCDMTPYSRPCQPCSFAPLGYDEAERNDSDCKRDSVREFDILSNLVFSTTSELGDGSAHSACHNNPSPTTVNVSTVDSMVATPPCLFDGMTSTQEMLQNTVDHELKLSSFGTMDTQQQKQMQYDSFSMDPSQRANGSPMACDTSPTSTTVELEKPKKLEDFKVQDLKNECKKRQLPVSGAKPQLLERLRPYEESIVLGTNGLAHSGSLGNSSRDRVVSNDGGCTYETVSQSQEVMNGYVKQMAAQHSIPQQTLNSGNILQFNSPQQLVQLVDSTGIIVGVATVQAPQSSCCCTGSSQPVEMPLSCSSSNERSLPSVTIRQPTVSFPLSLQSNSPQPTFSFAQHGSGGQFTLAPQENAQSMENQETRQMDPRPVMKSHTNYVMERRTSMCCQQSPKSLSAGLAVRQRPRCFSGPVQKSHNSLARPPMPSSMQNCSIVPAPAVPITQTSPAVGDQPGSSPNLPAPSDSSGNCPQTNRVVCDSDESSSVVLSAQTFSIHEDMLRLQQKKIEELQTELTKSQVQLRQQQQAILNAKKAQVKLESGIVDPVQAAFLNKLDIKNLNKYHIQLFLQHKLQLQKLQAQVQDFKTLQSAESRLQEELHIEQAVHDIVRLIKQDSRTALLIVQLLRRYQIERNCSSNSSTAQVAKATEQPEEPSGPKSVPTVNNDANGQRNAICTIVEGDELVTSEPTHSCASNCTCNRHTNHKVDQSGGDQAMPENVEIETMQNKESGDAGNVKKSNKNGPKKRNGIKSIWSRMNSLKALNQKDTPQGKCNGTDSSKNTSGTQGSSTVDMEEIFRTVLEDASKALNESESSYAPQQASSVTVGQQHSDEPQMQTVYTIADKISSPLQENHNGNEEAVSSCTGQTQYIDFNPSVQTYVDDASYPFQQHSVMENAPGTESVYEIRDSNVVYVAHNPIADNSLETQPPPQAQNSQVSHSYENKELDELMDALQPNDDESVLYCPSTMNGLNGYSDNVGDQWMEADYANASPNQSQMAADGYINVYCGMGDASGASQQLQCYGELDGSATQSTILLGGDHGLFGMAADIGCGGAFNEPIYMQQGVASITDDYSS